MSSASRLVLDTCPPLPGFLLDKKIGVNQPKRMENVKILIANTGMDTDKIKVGDPDRPAPGAAAPPRPLTRFPSGFRSSARGSAWTPPPRWRRSSWRRRRR